MKLWLDDEKENREPQFPADKGWLHFPWPAELISFLDTHWDEVEIVSLDHDLGDLESSPERTGEDVLKWIEEQVKTKSRRLPFQIWVHSMNAAAQKKMKVAVESITEKAKLLEFANELRFKAQEALDFGLGWFEETDPEHALVKAEIERRKKDA